MARSISNAAIAKLAQTHGPESVIIVEIAWAKSGKATRYATKDVSAPSDAGTVNIPGKLQSITEIDSVVAISLNETSEEFGIVLNDTDGSIKSIINVNDIMLRDVWVYQWFEGLQFEDRFLIFRGKINSPITWSETDRTVKLAVVSQLEDKSVGFSPEEGGFPDLPDDMVGKIWPECFGTSINHKAIQVDFKQVGTLATPVGLADFTIPSTLTAMGVIQSFLNSLGLLYAIAAGFAGILGMDDAQAQLENKANGFFAQASAKQQEIIDLNSIYQDQLDTEVTQFRVIGGEYLPRGSLKLKINDAIFTGSFQGAKDQAGSDVFKISCAEHPEAKNFYVSTTPCGNEGCASFQHCKTFPFAEGYSVTQVTNQTFFFPTGNIIGDQAGEFFAQGGASVSIFSAEPLRYFASITPGSVEKVAAFATFEGQRVLIDVPTEFYTTFTQNYGSVSVKVIQVNDALSKQDPPWEDTIYITYKSAVGPNTIDIMKYLIGKYADIGYDTTSFASCRAAINNYPMHFCLTRKKNIITVLKELAFMARMAVYIKSGKFFCRYLPAEPPSVFTFNEVENVAERSIELGFTHTEDLVTKYVANWRAHGAQDEDDKVIIDYNVKKYGIHEQTVDFYAYNYISAIVKSLTFWINRKGNTFKILKFKAFLDALNVETFDGVTLDFNSDYVANGPVKGIVEGGSYDPTSNTLDFTVWTGVRAGEMSQYNLAYPQRVNITTTFPSNADIAEGFAGGDGPGKTASGNIERKGRKQGLTVTFENDDPYDDGVRKKQDLGSKKPSDLGDTSPGEPIVNPTGQTEFGIGPPLTPAIVNTPIVDPGESFWIDIRTTKIADSANAGQTATLDTFFREITGNVLKGRTDCIWKSDDNEAIFDFKFDTEGAKFGAGTAFLKD